jgi:L,D-transpeptidase ErfK/SrfK
MLKQYFILFFAAIIFFVPNSILAAVYNMPTPGNDIIGHVFVTKVKYNDSVNTIRQRYEVSYEELVDANPNINFYKLRVGQSIIIPTEFILPKYRQGIVINIPELRLYYFTPDGNYVYTCPVGLGRQDWRTPTVITKIVRKTADPTWHVPESIRDYVYSNKGVLLPDNIPPGADNPLGKYALYLNYGGYMIHGTNQPDTVGMFISSGCMRLMHDSIQKLFEEVTVGTPVYIIHHTNKTGWMGDTLYMESHEPVKGYLSQAQNSLNNMDPNTAVYTAVTNRPAYVNWAVVDQIADNHYGIPEPIGNALEAQ